MDAMPDEDTELKQMIEKIISNGNPGAGVLALDLAVKLGIPYEGWISDIRPVEKNYNLRPLSPDLGASPLEAAVRQAHGTLCFTISTPVPLITEGLRKMTERFGKPFLAIDVTKTYGFSASRQTAAWIAENQIRVLHVGGGGYDASFNATVADILEAIFFLSMMDTAVSFSESSVIDRKDHPVPVDPPQTLDAALDHLETVLSLKDKARIANMAEKELGTLHFGMGTYIDSQFDLYSPSSALLTDCQRCSGRWGLASEDAAAVIIRFLWERFRQTYRVRIVK